MLATHHVREDSDEHNLNKHQTAKFLILTAAAAALLLSSLCIVHSFVPTFKEVKQVSRHRLLSSCKKYTTTYHITNSFSALLSLILL